MGSPPAEPGRFAGNEIPHRRLIRRRFAIAATEVSVRQFQAFLHETPALRFSYITRYSPDPDGPQISISWYHAAEYCNWLSRREELPECYEPNPSGQYAPGMRIKPDALSRAGYRLPTEAEWEYTCRAGAVTSRYHGESVALLERYAWYNQNSGDRARPCGQLQPNELGLFDMLGNSYEWCQDQAGSYPVPGASPPDDTMNTSLFIIDNNIRILRGGAFTGQPALVRTANRLRMAPSLRFTYCGVRLARTYH
jgi:formylglycine-generating enzyme required for sulfatase activity